MEHTSEGYEALDIQHSENTIINIKSNKNIDKCLPIEGCNLGEICYSTYINNCGGTKCWHCSYKIDSINISIPKKYINGIFYIYGSFCSYQCGARYILDTYKDKNMWEIYSLLNLYYNMTNNTIGHKITPAPDKLLLTDYGGHMDIDEYRKSFNTTDIYNIYQPPIIPIKHKSNIVENKQEVDNKHNYKLYRKKPINTNNNIYNTMNLIKT